ncbi:MAG: hypothetical protein IPH28_07605 [Cytophagaceae bacterium]|nr:hypothetical protein [Cytophagaceae bacterium]
MGMTLCQNNMTFMSQELKRKYFERGSSAGIGIFTEGNSAKKYYLSSRDFPEKIFPIFITKTALDARNCKPDFTVLTQKFSVSPTT